MRCIFPYSKQPRSVAQDLEFFHGRLSDLACLETTPNDFGRVSGDFDDPLQWFNLLGWDTSVGKIQ
jgi:hypothetical protein